MDSEVSNYLNKVKSALVDEVKLVQKEIDKCNNNISSHKQSINTANNETITGEDKIRELTTLKSNKEKERSLTSNIEAILKLNKEINELDKEIIKNDVSIGFGSNFQVGFIGNLKTYCEQVRVKLLKYQSDCKSLIEKIESMLEDPNEYDNPKDEVINEIKMLNTECNNLNKIESETISINIDTKLKYLEL